VWAFRGLAWALDRDRREGSICLTPTNPEAAAAGEVDAGTTDEGKGYRTVVRSISDFVRDRRGGWL
jgi:hypothetical protein